jgi:hypothetical protein
MVQNGHQPQVAAGFGQFMIAPQIAEATASHLEQTIKNPKTTPFDTHPPLSARIEKARSWKAASVDANTNPAISLIDDLPTLELSLLRKVLPGVSDKALTPVDWQTLGEDVYVPMWRSQTAALLPILAKHNIGDVPDLLKRLDPITSQLKDPPGTLLTRDQRSDRAASVVQSALILALIQNGWTLHAKPGFVSLASGDMQLEPGRIFPQLRSGILKKEDWLTYCEKAGIGQWPLATLADAATA